MVLKILATGDVHIGRRPTKLPTTEDASRYSCARLWEQVVQRAIDESVDLVMLSGDIVDHENRYFEATGPLERGLQRLARQGIVTYAVAGNHDFDVLPRITKSIGPESFQLLGQGGRWERATFERNGQSLLSIDGWSFPEAHVQTSPLASYSLQPDDHLPTVGLLHADLDSPDSEYAPVSRSELEAHDLAIWVLGHVHRPWLLRELAGVPILNPGSPQAMDPGETGVHGPWLIEIHDARDVRASQLPMSQVRYDWLPIDVSEAKTMVQFEDRVNQAVGQYVGQIGQEPGPPDVLSLRLRLVGQTDLYREIDGYQQKLLDEIERTSGKVTARVNQIVNDCRPAIDLRQLARRSDPIGILAQSMIALEQESSDQRLQCLIQDALGQMVQVHEHAAYSGINRDPPPDREQACRSLMHGMRVLLETLRHQE